MGRLSGAERIAIWQERLDRYVMSNQTVTDFCKTEGVSVPSYYHWKRRLSTPHRDSAAAKQKTRKQRELQGGNTAATPFTELIVTGQQATAKAQLPNGVSIALGCDQAIAAVIVDRLLAYEPATASSDSASRSPC
ncbi:MAG: hypothetical protein GY924_26705 [Planctomycetaceae bacterium]|nr:hypothetical protein [Planctomycetaceae bacterium]